MAAAKLPKAAKLLKTMETYSEEYVNQFKHRSTHK